MEGFGNEILEEIRNSVVTITANQTKRLTDVTKRHDLAISNISDKLCEVKQILKGFQGTCCKSWEQGSNGVRSIKLDLPRFSGEDPQGWRSISPSIRLATTPKSRSQVYI